MTTVPSAPRPDKPLGEHEQPVGFRDEEGPVEFRDEDGPVEFRDEDGPVEFREEERANDSDRDDST